MKRLYTYLFLILSLAFCLRFYQVGRLPAALYWDEVSIGYNAYSIVETAHDEWGRLFPLFFEAFNEYKFSVPIYLVALMIKIFGYQDIVIRLPAVLLGMGVCLLSYLLLKEISGKRKLSLIFAFLIAISPWHLQFSRPLFEANIALFFHMLALLFLIKNLKRERRSLSLYLLFALSILLSSYSYSPFIMINFLVAGAAIWCFSTKSVQEKVREIVLISMMFFMIELPFIVQIRKVGFTRFSQVSAFEENEVLQRTIALRQKYGENSKIIFNQYAAGMIIVLNNLSKYLNPYFFWPGKDGNPRHQNGFGLVYPFEFAIILIGLYFLRKQKKIFLFTVISFLMPLLVASFTKESPHALRSFAVVIYFCLFTAYGLYKAQKIRLMKIILIIIYGAGLNVYLIYYYRFTMAQTSAWGNGNKEMMSAAKGYFPTTKTVYFTGDDWRPYIYYYHYFKIDPRLVQKNNNSTRLGNVYFGYATWDLADRRYDYSFNLTKLFTKDGAVLFLSPREAGEHKKELVENGFQLKKEVIYNKMKLFSIYEK